MSSSLLALASLPGNSSNESVSIKYVKCRVILVADDQPSAAALPASSQRQVDNRYTDNTIWSATQYFSQGRWSRDGTKNIILWCQILITVTKCIRQSHPISQNWTFLTELYQLEKPKSTQAANVQTNPPSTSLIGRAYSQPWRRWHRTNAHANTLRGLRTGRRNMTEMPRGYEEKRTLE